MRKNTNIESQIMAIVRFNLDARNELWNQYVIARELDWGRDEIENLIKSDFDVAEEHFEEGSFAHTAIREVQDAIINYYGKDES